MVVLYVGNDNFSAFVKDSLKDGKEGSLTRYMTQQLVRASGQENCEFIAHGCAKNHGLYGVNNPDGLINIIDHWNEFVLGDEKPGWDAHRMVFHQDRKEFSVAMNKTTEKEIRFHPERAAVFNMDALPF